MNKKYSKKDIERMKFAIAGRYIGCYLCSNHPLFKKYGEKVKYFKIDPITNISSHVCSDKLCLYLFPLCKKDKTCPCHVYSDKYINWKVKSELNKLGVKYEKN